MYARRHKIEGIYMRRYHEQSEMTSLKNHSIKKEGKKLILSRSESRY